MLVSGRYAFAYTKLYHGWLRMGVVGLLDPLGDPSLFDLAGLGEARRVARVREHQVEVVRPEVQDERNLGAVRRDVLHSQSGQCRIGLQARELSRAVSHLHHWLAVLGSAAWWVDTLSRPGVKRPVGPYDVAVMGDISPSVVCRHPTAPRVRNQRRAPQPLPRVLGLPHARSKAVSASICSVRVWVHGCCADCIAAAHRAAVRAEMARPDD